MCIFRKQKVVMIWNFEHIWRIIYRKIFKCALLWFKLKSKIINNNYEKLQKNPYCVFKFEPEKILGIILDNESKNIAWKISKYGVFSGPHFPISGLNTVKHGPEKSQYLGTFHTVKTNENTSFYRPVKKTDQSVIDPTVL